MTSSTLPSDPNLFPQGRLLSVNMESIAPGLEPRLCIRCNLPFVLVMVPCPDAIPGCCVLHYGHRCPQCGGAVYDLPEISLAAWEQP